MDPNRDYAAEMRAVIDSETTDEEFVPVEVAERIVNKLTATDQELLTGWLWVQSVQLVREHIIRVNNNRRGHIKRYAAQSTFAGSAERYATGDEHAMTTWLTVRYNVGGAFKTLGHMTAAEVTAVADDFGKKAAGNLMQEAFLRAVAKKCRRGTVEETFTPEKLDALWRSLTEG